MKNLHSCFGRGQGAVNPNDRQSPLSASPGRPTPGLYDHGAEVLCTRPWRSFVIPTGNGFMQVSLNKSWDKSGSRCHKAQEVDIGEEEDNAKN